MTNDLTAIRAKATDPRTTVSPVGTTTVLSLCDEVQSLRAENDRLRAALTIIAEWAETADSYEAIMGRARTASIARAALTQKGDE